MAEIDLTELVRDLGRTMRATATYALALRDDPVEVAGFDPYVAARWVSTKATFDALGGGRADPAAPYLRAWVAAFALGRVNLAAEVEAWGARCCPAVRMTLPRAVEVSVREAVGAVVAEPAAARRVEVIGAIAAAAGGAAGLERELWARRGETLRRLGEGAGEALSLLDEGAPIGPVAEQILASTDDLASHVLGASSSWADALGYGTGRDDDVPWPRLSSAASVADCFRGDAGWLAVHDLNFGRFPPSLAGSSMTRAFARFGARWADAAASREVPLPLAHLPTGLARYAMGALIAGLLAAEPFLTRTLGMTRAEASRARRSQARVVLVAARLAAARVLVREAALAGDPRVTVEVARETMTRALGRDYPASLALVVPRLHAHDPARLLAFGEGARLFRDLVEHFDVDWHRNPRAVFALRDRLGRSPVLRMPAEVARAGVDLLARDLAERLD